MEGPHTAVEKQADALRPRVSILEQERHRLGERPPRSAAHKVTHHGIVPNKN